MQKLPDTRLSRTTPAWWTDLLLLTVVIGALFFIFLGSRPLFVPDEGRYAEIAREMFTSGDYITPRLNGIIYFEKPALFYWLSALAFKLTGVHLWTVRSINALLALAGCLLTYLTARALYDRLTGMLAALILASSLLYFIMAHMVSLDMTVTFFIMTCLYTFLLGAMTAQSPSRRFYFYAAAGSAALAVLTKGLIGIVFPVLIVGSWSLLTGRIREIRQWHIPGSLFLFLLIVTPWHLLAQLQHPAFFHFYFIEQHILRYTDLSIGHYEPVWFFIPYLLLGFAPWIVFLPQTIRWSIRAVRKPAGDESTLFFLLWATIVFLFFSFSKSKLIPYILPLFPALAMLTARYLTVCHCPRQQISRTLMAMIAATSLGLVTLMAVAPRLDTRTIRPLAAILIPTLAPHDEVVTYNQYFQDLPFYLQRNVSILNWKNELRFGMQLEDTRGWMIDDNTFWRRWNSSQRVFVLISKAELEQLQKKYPRRTFHLLGETATNALIVNRPQ